MQGAISFSIESIISRKDPPKDRTTKTLGHGQLHNYSTGMPHNLPNSPRDSFSLPTVSVSAEEENNHDALRSNEETVAEKHTESVIDTISGSGTQLLTSRS